MPFSEQHQKQKHKNLALLGVLILFMAVLFILTIVKFTPAHAA